MLFTLGLNHRTAPLAVREQVCFPAEALPRALSSLINGLSVREAAILSTCNRTELYCHTTSPGTLIDWWANYHQIERQRIHPHLYALSQDQAITHAFRVASGLDSMVVGETQILGQMKDAMRHAAEAGTLGPHLHQLFQHAFSVAKTVRSNTAIGQNVISLAAASVRLAKRVFPSLESSSVLFLGAGEMIAHALAHFAAQHPARMTLANRTLEQGRSLAKRHAAQSIRLDELAEQLPRHDVVISCTASPHPLIDSERIAHTLRQKPGHRMVLIDLAVPRDIEPGAGAHEGISLYTIDDLGKIVSDGLDSRQAAIAEAEGIITARSQNFLLWLQGRETVPTIRALRDSAERLRRHELERAIKRLNQGENPAAVLEQLSQRLTNKFLHAPTQTLHLAEGEARHHLRAAATRLFQLNQ